MHSFDQEDIVKGSGYIIAQCCGNSEIELGAVYAVRRGSAYSWILTGIRWRTRRRKYILSSGLPAALMRLSPWGIFEVSEPNGRCMCWELKAYDRMLCFLDRVNGFETIGTFTG